MAEIREVKGSWTCTAEVGEMPLAKGLRLTVEAAALGQEKDVVCEVVGWQYRVGKREDGSKAATLEITVQAVKEPGLIAGGLARFEQWFTGLSDETKFKVPLLTAFFVSAICVAAAWTLYVQPDHGLAFVGRHVRTVGGCVVLGLFLVLLPSVLGLYRGTESFAKSFFAALLTLTGFVALGCWLAFSRYPAKGFDWYRDGDCVTYARGLGSALSRSYWPILVALLPWISLSAKVFGLEGAGKIAEGLEKVAKKKKE